tara:strand:+ start:2362 stop:3027 length:666 start_codon:yes stop_codon:yes gene_type:complete
MQEKDSKNFWLTNEYKEYEEFPKGKEKFVKHGPDVIHLTHLGPVFDQVKLKEIENRLSKNGIRLSHYDKSGDIYAALEDFSLISFLAISQPIIGKLINGVFPNALWDTIKFTVSSIHQKVKNRNCNRATIDEAASKPMTFGMKVHIDKNTSFDFKLNGEFDENIVNSSLDKVLDYLKEIKPSPVYKRTEFVVFNSEKKKWERVDIEKEMLKLMKKGKLNKK